MVIANWPHGPPDSDSACLVHNLPFRESRAPLLALPEDAYLGVASLLDFASLCCLEVSCMPLRTIHCSTAGPWYLVGICAFYGVELATSHGFSLFEHGKFSGVVSTSGDGEVVQRCTKRGTDWKAYCQRFYQEAATLDDLCSASVVSCQCRLRMDLLEQHPGCGIYVEIATLEKVSSLLFGIRGGHEGISSLLFAPEQGLVQEIWLVPGGSASGFKRIQTRFNQLLRAAPFGHCFRGKAGFYLCGAQVAFFRKWDDEVVNNDDNEAADVLPTSPKRALRSDVPNCWETTGFITGPCWAAGQRLSIYLGSQVGQIGHCIRITRIGSIPPLWPIISNK